jgi:hypothetical protein
MTAATSTAPIQKEAAAYAGGLKRELYVFDIPASMKKAGTNVCFGGGAAVDTVALKLLLPNEERMVARRCGQDAVRLAYELAMESLAEVNEQPVSVADGTSDDWWGRLHPQVRQLVMTAYVELNTPPDRAAEDFLESRRVKSS